MEFGVEVDFNLFPLATAESYENESDSLIPVHIYTVLRFGKQIRLGRDWSRLWKRSPLSRETYVLRRRRQFILLSTFVSKSYVQTFRVFLTNFLWNHSFIYYVLPLSQFFHKLLTFRTFIISERSIVHYKTILV